MHAPRYPLMTGLAALATAAVVAGSSQGQQPQQPPRFQEHVAVSRLLLDARVLDGSGSPVFGLGAADFTAKIDGRPAHVESATWTGATSDGKRPAVATELPLAAPEPPGRLIVFLFQKDLEPSRIIGLMRLLLRSDRLLAGFGPDDRIAILSFDSHLKFWLDFTNDRARIRAVMTHGILFDDPETVEPGVFPSLARYLSADAGRRAYTMEKALMLLGDALQGLPGAKSVILVGYGFGQTSGAGVSIDREYSRARVMLQSARASVFCLDETDADAHTLEVGLELVAADTGGFFERTNRFPDGAVSRLIGALAGSYVLFIEVPDGLGHGAHDVELRLAGRKGTVLARQHFTN
jgi:hypothetical protein